MTARHKCTVSGRVPVMQARRNSNIIPFGETVGLEGPTWKGVRKTVPILLYEGKDKYDTASIPIAFCPFCGKKL